MAVAAAEATRRKKRRIAAFDVVNVVIMLLFAVSIIYPFYFCILIAFNDGLDSLIPGMYLWTRKPTLDNFKFIFMSGNFALSFANSVARTVVGTVLHIAVTFTASYGLYKVKLLKKVYTVYFFITMYIGGGLIPTYILIKNLGLLDNFLVYIVPGMWGFYNCLLIMAYLRGNVYSAIEESAHIDGAGPFRTLASIIFPVSLPVIATIALFCAVGQWNSWFDTVIYTKSDNLETLQSMLMKLVKEAENIKSMVETMSAKGQNVDFLKANIQPNGIRVATMLVVILPIVCVYPFLQKYFVKGIMIGAVKG